MMTCTDNNFNSFSVLSMHDFFGLSREDVEVIIDGSGLMFGDYEAITMVRVLGIDETPPYNENKSLFFSLMSFILNSQFSIPHSSSILPCN